MAYVTDHILFVDSFVYNKTESIVTFSIRNSKSTFFRLLKQLIVVTFYRDTLIFYRRFLFFNQIMQYRKPYYNQLTKT